MADGTWERVAALDRLDPDEPYGVYIEGTDIAVYMVGGEVFATSGICTHAFARLAEGTLEGGRITCPLHQGSFDVRTGEATSAPCQEALATFPAKVEDGVVYVRL